MIFRNRRRTNAPFRNLFRSRRTRRIFVLHQHSHNPDTSTPDRRSRFESIPRTLACTLRTDTRRWASNMFFPPRIPEGSAPPGRSAVSTFINWKQEERFAFCASVNQGSGHVKLKRHHVGDHRCRLHRGEWERSQSPEEEFQRIETLFLLRSGRRFFQSHHLRRQVHSLFIRA